MRSLTNLFFKGSYSTRNFSNAAAISGSLSNNGDAAWHTATSRGIEAENLARGYRDIATVSFAQPAAFTTKLADFTDRFMKERSLKVGFGNREDKFFKLLHGGWTADRRDKSLLHCSDAHLLDGERIYDSDELCTITHKYNPNGGRTVYKLSGTLLELEAPGGHGIANYAEYFGVIEITKPKPARSRQGKPGRARPAKENQQYEVEGGADDEVEVEDEAVEESDQDEEEESSEDDE